MKLSIQNFICLLGTLLTFSQSSFACIPGADPYRPSTAIAERSDKVRSKYTHHKKFIGKIHQLNSGHELVALTPNIRAYEGEFVFGRLTVPWTQREWRLTVSAFWTNHFYTTPLWIYLKRSNIPSPSNFDKASISFLSRKYSRVRLEDARPGSYYIMLEPLVDLHNITIGVSLIPPRQSSGSVRELIFPEIEYRPDLESEWISQNEILP